MKKAREQLEAVRWIESLEGEMHYDWDVDEQGIQLLNAQPPGPEWLRDLLGDTFFSEVVDLSLSDDKHYRSPGHTTSVTDEGAAHLECLTHLRTLCLFHTQVTDTGLQHIKNLQQNSWVKSSEQTWCFLAAERLDFVRDGRTNK